MKKILVLLALGSLALMAVDNAKAYQNCVMCHGKKGEKIALNSSPQLASLTQEKLRNSIGAIIDGTSKISKRYLSMHQTKLKDVSQREDETQAFSEYIFNLKQ
jgi:cytochrome c553